MAFQETITNSSSSMIRIIYHHADNKKDTPITTEGNNLAAANLRPDDKKSFGGDEMTSEKSSLLSPTGIRTYESREGERGGDYENYGIETNNNHGVWGGGGGGGGVGCGRHPYLHCNTSHGGLPHLSGSSSKKKRSKRRRRERGKRRQSYRPTPPRKKPRLITDVALPRAAVDTLITHILIFPNPKSLNPNCGRIANDARKLAEPLHPIPRTMILSVKYIRNRSCPYPVWPIAPAHGRPRDPFSVY
mmetsp:Transcript_17038/g.36723  ORF Transcript_17038/g.36723 Transcript_17038/m.36723 type:complete len:246 (+) Transcript_17038:150-887(+)